MERQMNRIRTFKAMASPAYMAMTYTADPIDYAFDMAQKAQLGVQREPEFKAEFIEIGRKCKEFAVAILNSCRNSAEVEMVLDDDCNSSSGGEGQAKDDQPLKLSDTVFSNNGSSVLEQQAKKPKYSRLYRAIYEDQKEFVAQPCCQLLLHDRWVGGPGLVWTGKGPLQKAAHVLWLVVCSPVLVLAYLLSPFRDHKPFRGPLAGLLRHLDRPINRFILDMASYAAFLTLIFLSIVHGVGNQRRQNVSWYVYIIVLWVVCSLVRDLGNLLHLTVTRRKTLPGFRFAYDLAMDTVFLTAICFKYYGYEIALKDVVDGGHRGAQGPTVIVLHETHPINVGANIYGVGACMAFLKVIFYFEVHSRFGPILFCIRNVFWDIATILLSYLVTVFAFGVGLVSIFGVYDEDATRFSGFEKTFKTLFWILFDPGKEEYADIGQEGRPQVQHPLRMAFGSAFNFVPKYVPVLRLAPPDEENQGPRSPAGHQRVIYASGNYTVDPQTGSLSHNIGIYVWGAYQVLVVLIMMNLLISLMTTTFARIQRDADTEWKFTRASLWIHYYNDSNAIPVPFNILPSAYSALKGWAWLQDRVFRRCCRSHRAQFSSLTSKSNKLMRTEAKRKGYSLLIDRVFRREQLKQEEQLGRTDLEALEKEISIDVAELRRDLRAMKLELLNSIKRSTLSVHASSEPETAAILPQAGTIAPKLGDPSRGASAVGDSDKALKPPDEEQYYARRLSRTFKSRTIDLVPEEALLASSDEAVAAAVPAPDVEEPGGCLQKPRKGLRPKSYAGDAVGPVAEAPSSSSTDDMIAHLVQTLGLIGVSPSFATDKQNNKAKF